MSVRKGTLIDPADLIFYEVAMANRKMEPIW